MKTSTTLYLALLLLTLACNRADERFDQAVAWARGGDYEQADSLFTVILQDDPAHDAALNNRAFVRTQMEAYEPALADIDRAILLDSTNHRYFEVRASIYLQTDQLDQAEADIHQAMALNDESSQAYFLLGILRTQQKSYPGALNALKRSLDLNPSSKEPLIQIVTVYVSSQQYEKAIYEATKLLDKGVLDPVLLVSRGFASMQMEQYQHAADDFRQALKLDGDHAAARNNLGYATYNLGDTTAGLELINESLLLNPDNAYAYKFRGQVKAAQDSTEAACADWQKAISLGFTAKHDSSVISLIQNRCN